ncbi:alpha/beta fold hydrolase [Streptomyces buecherae]|uniref:thioesterase II family protein n=1 Tax=Streptomyces buecherae TaxID=2763006 RepID=UPI0033E60BDD
MTPPTTDPQTWIRRFHPAADDAVRLVCFPHAGGSASFYFPVSAQLSPAVDVRAVQYPGRQDRRAEPTIDDLHRLADALVPALGPLADRPLAFFGHSMGAVVAYEVALRLAAAGAPPLVRLFVSGRRAPSRVRAESVHERDDQGIVAELQRLSGTDAGLLDDPETRAMILPAIRGDYRAIETYRVTPGSTVRAPLSVLVGDSDPQVTLDEARAWSEHTTGPVDLRVFSGGHFYLSERSGEVIRLVADELANAARPDATPRA